MAQRNLLVKDNGVVVKVYTNLPAGVVDESLYTKLDQPHSKAVRALFTGKYAYLADQLKDNGIAVLGRKNRLKKDVRSIVGGSKPAPASTTERTRKAGPTKAEQDEAIARNEKINAAVKLLTDAGMPVDFAQIAALAK